MKMSSEDKRSGYEVQKQFEYRDLLGRDINCKVYKVQPPHVNAGVDIT